MIEPTQLVAIVIPLLVGIPLLAVGLLGKAEPYGWALGLAGGALIGLAPTIAVFVEGAAGGPIPALFGSATYAVALCALAAAGAIAFIKASLSTGEGPTAAPDAPGDPGLKVEAGSANRLRGLLKREHQKLHSAHEMHRYLELATRNSQITVFLQNAKLEYLWIVNPRLGLSSEEVVGRSDHQIIPDEAKPLVIGHKERAMATGTTQTFEAELLEGDEPAWFRVDVVPVMGGDGEATGVVCTAIDITRSKRLDAMRTDLARRLAETLQRFNLALRSERIVVFSQDLTMRYTWANADETQIGSIVGRTDDEVLPAADRPAIAALKQMAIETKEPQSGEVGIGEGDDRRWYDLHVEPNVQADGIVTGITCASIDITNRKRNEEQMRLVMRELTHRTKNLLAVMIAITRQTATNAKSIDTFVPALVGRLRALSVTQDLLVAKDWAGVELQEVIDVLVTHPGSRSAGRLHVGGPPVILSPEAAQNLGLAIHELATNAVKFGALSAQEGKLSVTWTVESLPGGETLVLSWCESGVPNIAPPDRKGFGMMVIERNLTRAMHASVDLSFAKGGLCATIGIPVAHLGPMNRPDEIRLARAG